MSMVINQDFQVFDSSKRDSSTSYFNEYDQLISLLYDCAASEEGFSPFLSKACEYLNATTGLMCSFDKTTHKGRIVWYHGYPKGLIPLLIKTGASRKDEAMVRALDAEPDTVYSYSKGDECFDILAGMGTFSKTWIKAMGLKDTATFTFELIPNERHVIIFNRIGDQGIFKDTDLDLLHLVSSHIKKAVNFYETLFMQKRINEGFEMALSTVDLPLILFANNGMVAAINDAMEKLNKHYSLFHHTDGQIQFYNESVNAFFERQLLAFFLEDKERSTLPEVVFIPTESEPIRLTLRPLFKKKKRFSGVLIEAKDINSITYPSLELIQSILNVTPSEARIIEFLIRGENVKNIARKIHLSEHTVRGYIKSSMEKNKFKRQIEMISFILKVVV